MSTGANLGHTAPISGSIPDGFVVANLAEGTAAVAERADETHVASRKLLVIVEDADAATAIEAAQHDGVEADVWAIAVVNDADHAAHIAASARAGGRDNVGCVRYAPSSAPTDGVVGWLGTVQPT